MKSLRRERIATDATFKHEEKYLIEPSGPVMGKKNWFRRNRSGDLEGIGTLDTISHSKR